MLRILFAFFLLLTFTSSCGLPNSPTKFYENKTPAKTADTFYKFVMWKYYEKASPFVHPEHLYMYEDMVLRNEKDLNITGYKIKELFLLDQEDEKNGTQVSVLITYYKYPSVSEKSVILKHLWIKEGKNWYVKTDFDEEIFN